MRRLGYRKIGKHNVVKKKRPCESCGEAATFEVTFADNIGRVIVLLCKKCLWKGYTELKVQSRLDFPLSDRGQNGI